MNTTPVSDNLKKGIEILMANIQDTTALEALVRAMEACLEGKEYHSSGEGVKAVVEAPVKPKHILEDYQITEKDVGSLCVFSEDLCEDTIEILRSVDSRDCEWPFQSERDYWFQGAERYLGSVALHFIPFYATEDSVAPDDALAADFVATLWSDGDITIWDKECGQCSLCANWVYDEYSYIIGYRPLSFINPLEK